MIAVLDGPDIVFKILIEECVHRLYGFPVPVQTAHHQGTFQGTHDQSCQLERRISPLPSVDINGQAASLSEASPNDS